jgi:protein TonB
MQAQTGNTRWTAAVALAIGLHAAVIGTCLFRLAFSSRLPRADAVAIAVDFAPQAAAPPAPKRDVAPGPDQVKTPKVKPLPTPVVKKLPFDPPPETKAADIKPDVAFAKQSAEDVKPDVQKQPPAPDTTRQVALDVKADKKLEAPITGGVSAGSTKAEALWDALVRAKLGRLLRYPIASMRLHEEDTVMVRLVIDRSGRLLSSALVHSKGYARLDGEAMDLVRRASPLPKPPPEVQGDTIDFAVPIDFYFDTAKGR